MKNRELEWEVRREERGNSWPSLEYSEFKRQWAGDNSPQASTHTQARSGARSRARQRTHKHTSVRFR